jgi:hypothetical protein
MGTNVTKEYFQAASIANIFYCFLLKIKYTLLEKPKNEEILQINFR